MLCIVYKIPFSFILVEELGVLVNCSKIGHKISKSVTPLQAESWAVWRKLHLSAHDFVLHKSLGCVWVFFYLFFGGGRGCVLLFLGGYTSLVFCVNLGHLTWVRLQEQCSLWELGWLYLATAAPRTVQFMGNLGCLTWVRLQQPQEQCYPFWAVCAVFLCVQIMVCLPVFGIFVWTVDASNCTWGLYKHWKSIWTVSWLWGKKSLAALGNQTCRVLHLGFGPVLYQLSYLGQCSTSWTVLHLFLLLSQVHRCFLFLGVTFMDMLIVTDFNVPGSTAGTQVCFASRFSPAIIASSLLPPSVSWPLFFTPLSRLPSVYSELTRLTWSTSTYGTQSRRMEELVLLSGKLVLCFPSTDILEQTFTSACTSGKLHVKMQDEQTQSITCIISELCWEIQNEQIYFTACICSDWLLLLPPPSPPPPTPLYDLQDWLIVKNQLLTAVPSTNCHK